MRALALASLVLLGSCAKGGGVGSIPGLEQFLPKVAFRTFNVKDIDFEKVDTVFVFDVTNPNPIGIGMASFSWQLDLNGDRFLSGDEPEGLRLEPQGSSAVKLPVSVVFADLISGITGTQGKDEVPFALSGTMGFNTPLGVAQLPYRATGQFPVLRVPTIGLQGVRVDNIDILRQSATIAIDLAVSHKGASAMSFTGFDYSFALGGRTLVDGVVRSLATVPAGTTETVSLPITVNLLSAGATIVDAITKKERIDVSLDATVTVETPFGAVPMSIDETGRFSVQ